MVALFAISSIVGGLLTSISSFAVFGAWGLLLGPFGGSLAAVAVAMLARTPAPSATVDMSIDDMVADLRSVLPEREAGRASDREFRRKAG